MLKILPLGGMGNVTKNMFIYETQDQILIVDCGIGFPDDSMLGVDLLLPDITYLQDKKQKIKGILLTHAHDDHIAGLPYILPKLGNVPIYASRLTTGFAQDRLKEYKLKPKFILINNNPFKIGQFDIAPIKVTHSVPDARHFAISTPEGIIYHGSDYKFDLSPVDGVLSDLDKIKAVGDKGILCLMSDCLRVEESGHSPSESLLKDSLETQIKSATHRAIITLMSSNIHRVQLVANAALKVNRKLAFIGRSVESNVRTARRLGFLKIPQNSIISRKQIKNFRPHELVIVIAGSQGQTGSSLERATSGEHAQLKIQKTDKIIFASDAIPGNENPVYTLIDSLFNQGANVSYSDITENLHVSGHAYAGEQEQLIKLTRPKYLFPIGGTYRHMALYKKMAQKLNYSPNNVFLLEDGQSLEFQNNQVRLGPTIQLQNVFVDGLGVGDVGSVVLRDRKNMADDGIVVLLVPVQKNSNKVNGKIEVISRGFVYMKQSKQLVNQLKSEVKKSIANLHPRSTRVNIRRRIESNLEKFIYKKTQRRPLILTVILEV